MEQTQERRVSGVRRVSLERVVDVCDKGQSKSAFQAQSIDVSGRGMHVRASFLPELDAPLVLRFHEPEREIVVEGEVAWRTETSEGGGEFGVRFTALDSQSVRWLKTVCAQADAGEAGPRSVAKRLKNVFDVGDDPSDLASDEQADAGSDGDGAEHEVDLAPFETPPERSEDASEQTDNDLPPVVSSTVKLHLAGLATPMRAEVKEQGHRRLDVGSNLEFLRVGRSLEVEEVGVGRRRQAEIEGVNVAIDPRSQIPQLILSLRYPEPAQSEAPRLSEPPPSVTYAKSVSKKSAFSSDDSESGAGEGEGPELFGMKLPQPVGEAIARAQGLARRAGEQCARLGLGARRATRWLRTRARRPERAVPATRRTAPVFRAPPVQLRPQRGGPSSTQRAPAPNTRRDVLAQRTMRRYGVLLLLFVTAIGVGAWWGTGKRARATASEAPVKTRAIPRPSVVEPAPSAAPPAANQLVATEPAPSPAREEAAELPRFAAQQPERTLSPAERVLASPPPAAKSAPIVFENVPPSAPARREPAAQAVVGSTEFSRGKLHLPVIHRLRLDGPASRVVGEPTSSGFNIVIPGRKVMENGAAISKRDRRISRVATRNNNGGAKIAFDFKGTIPAYKIRLRQDYVEIFISSSK
jgi:PilZ domain-containing protein